MEIGDKITYYGSKVTVLDQNKTHVLIEFENKSKYCVKKGFKK